MNVSEFCSMLRATLSENADRTARDNGASRGRSLEEYRFNSGIVAGLKQALFHIDEILGEIDKDGFN